MKIKISEPEAKSLKKFVDPEGQVLVFGTKRRKPEGTWQTPFARVELATGRVVKNDWNLPESEIRHYLGNMIAGK